MKFTTTDCLWVAGAIMLGIMLAPRDCKAAEVVYPTGKCDAESLHIDNRNILTVLCKDGTSVQFPPLPTSKVECAVVTVVQPPTPPTRPPSPPPRLPSK